MTTTFMAVWRWLLTPMKARPRRIAVLAWWLVFLFSNGINHVLQRYHTIIDPVILAGIIATGTAAAILLLRACLTSPRRTGGRK